MQKRALALALPLGLAACADAPLAPDAAAPPAAVSADAAPVADAVVVSAERQEDLGAALDDARLRLLPAFAAEDGAPPPDLAAALVLLDERVAAGDAAGVLAAVAEAEAALDALPAAQSDASLPEADALRLTLEEVRLSAGGPAL